MGLPKAISVLGFKWRGGEGCGGGVVVCGGGGSGGVLGGSSTVLSRSL